MPTPIQSDVHDHLLWMRVHNYASTTIEGRARYLSYFLQFAAENDILNANEVTLELLVAYQQRLFAHRKNNGEPLSFGTQAQRLIPIAQFFSWLRRERRIVINPAGDLLMPRPDRRLPEATLSVTEMSALCSAPVLSTPLGLRDRAVLEVFYSCALRRSELISLWLRDIDFERGTAFVRCGKGSKDRYVPVGERALFWVRLSRSYDQDSSRPVIPTTSSSRPRASPCVLTGWDARCASISVRPGSKNEGAVTCSATAWPR